MVQYATLLSHSCMPPLYIPLTRRLSFFFRLKANPSPSFREITTIYWQQTQERAMQQQKQVSTMGEGIAVANVGVMRSGGGGGGTTGGGGGSVSVCRPSGSRWTPTPEQLRILKELYYGCGVRSPTAEQIQRITGMLRQHGKIEGKNVFYWFQNHKARERQKKRLTNLDVVNAPAADVGHLGVLSLSPSSAATTSPSSTLGMYTGNGGAAATVMSSSTDWDNTAMATEGCFLQDYMGVRGTGAGGHGSTGMATSPWAWFSSSDERSERTATTRAPETLPLFPTGDDNRQRPRRQGGPPAGGDDSYYYVPDHLSFWGAADPATVTTTATAATTTTTTVTIQQHQLLQMQQQYSFYNNNQLPSHETQLDTAAGAAGASLELSLSSWCSPHNAGTM